MVARSKQPNEPGVETYTILTTEPNDLLSDFHDRMPVIVQAADFDHWLENGSPELLRSIPSEMVEIAKARTARSTTGSLL